MRLQRGAAATITPRHDHVAGYRHVETVLGVVIGARRRRDCGVYLRGGD
jgi:hypothetical protein